MIHMGDSILLLSFKKCVKYPAYQFYIQDCEHDDEDEDRYKDDEYEEDDDDESTVCDEDNVSIGTGRSKNMEMWRIRFKSIITYVFTF